MWCFIRGRNYVDVEIVSGMLDDNGKFLLNLKKTCNIYHYHGKSSTSNMHLGLTAMARPLGLTFWAS
jgi:hypothetical protein